VGDAIEDGRDDRGRLDIVEGIGGQEGSRVHWAD
jgi:hypothetical protein